MSVHNAQAPGTIYAINNETGVKMYIREDMLKDKTNFDFTRLTGDDVPVLSTQDVGGPAEPKEKKLIMTKAGKPFKTEQSAKNAMKAQELSEMDYLVMPVDDGFIITKV